MDSDQQAQSYATNPVTSVVIPATMAGVEEVEVVVAHNERATLRVGDVFLKVDADQTRTDVAVEAMAFAPIPTPEIVWSKPPVLALAVPVGVKSATRVVMLLHRDRRSPPRRFAARAGVQQRAALRKGRRR